MTYKINLWEKQKHEVKNIFELSLKSNEEFSKNDACPIVFKKKKGTGQMSKSYQVQLAEAFPKSARAILYFPKNPKTPLIYVNHRWSYKQLQGKISKFLRESNGEVSEDCIKLVIWTNNKIYHCANLDKAFEFFWCSGIRFNNGNKFNKVIQNCPLLVQTDGECRIKMLVGLVPPNVDYNDTHGKNDLVILTPLQFQRLCWPNDLRHVADADPRRRKRLLPKTVTKEAALANTMAYQDKEKRAMVSNSDDIFGNDSDDSSNQDDEYPTEYEFPSESTETETENYKIQGVYSTPISNSSKGAQDLYSDLENLAYDEMQSMSVEHIPTNKEVPDLHLDLGNLAYDDMQSMSIEHGESDESETRTLKNETASLGDNKGKKEEE